MTSILVMCTGNICRSPIAEGLLRGALQARFGERAPVVSSAGTAGLEGRGAMAESIQAAAELGADIAGHAARALTPAFPQAADLVLCMAAMHREDVVHVDRDARAKTFTLKELVRLLEQLPEAFGSAPDDIAERVRRADAIRRDGFGGNPHDEDIADPLGMPLASYRAIAWELDGWTTRLVDGLYGPAEAASQAGGL